MPIGVSAGKAVILLMREQEVQELSVSAAASISVRFIRMTIPFVRYKISRGDFPSGYTMLAKGQG